MAWLSLLYSFVLLRLWSLANANCYYPDEVDTNEFLNTTAYEACGDSKSHSMCCRKNDNSPDFCRSDGLCINGDQLWRESCTDPKWESPACIQLCVSGTGQNHDGEDLVDFSTTHVLITTCNDGSLCCGDNTTSSAQTCCAKKQGVWLVDGEIYSTNPSSTMSETATLLSPPASAAPGTTSSPAQPSGSDSSNNTGAIVGGVVGGVAGLAAVIGLVWFLLRRKQSKRNSDEYDAHLAKLPAYGGVTQDNKVLYAQEAPAPAPTAELGGMETETAELPPTSPKQERPSELPS